MQRKRRAGTLLFPGFRGDFPDAFPVVFQEIDYGQREKGNRKVDQDPPAGEGIVAFPPELIDGCADGCRTGGNIAGHHAGCAVFADRAREGQHDAGKDSLTAAGNADQPE